MNLDPDTQIVIDNRAFPLDVRITPLDDHWTFTARKQKEKSIPIDEKLDDLAELFVHWSRNREQKITPQHIKSAILSLIYSIEKPMN